MHVHMDSYENLHKYVLMCICLCEGVSPQVCVCAYARVCMTLYQIICVSHITIDLDRQLFLHCTTEERSVPRSILT